MSGSGKHHEEVPPYGVHWVAFCQATDPATDASNFVSPGKLWVETDDDAAPTAVVALHIWNVDDSAWLTFPIGSGASVTSVFGRTGAVTATLSDYGLDLVDGPTTSKTANYTATTSDFAILGDATGGSLTITLPAAASNTGRLYFIKKTDSGANTVTVDGNASETIDGATTIVLGNENEAILIICNGTAWFILSRPGASNTGIQASILDALGDLVYASANDTPAKLAGNTTTTKKFLTQTGNGTISAAPGWNTLVSGDIPSSVALAGSPTTTTQSASDNSTKIATTAYVDAAVTAGAGAPTNADYLVKTANGSLSAERVVTDTTTVTWDWATGGQAKAQIPTDVPLPGSPTTTTQSGTDSSTKVATTAQVQAALAKQAEVLGFAVSDETTAITTGTAKITFRMPFAMTLTAVRANLNTVSSSGTPTIDIKESGTTIFSTKVTIDASELTSTTAATPAVLSDTSLADDAEMTVNIDVAGTGAKGLKIWLIGTRT